MAIAAAALSAFACSGPARRSASTFTQKLVILGFDGMDPHLLQTWMAEGKLPNIAALAKQGGFSPLQTTHSPESPTAWASFATGVNAGKHNIYDFLVRDTATYLPDLGMVERTPPKFLFNYFPIARPKVQSTRGGTSFWVTAGKAGVRSDMLTVPVTFPPEDVENGELLSGLPLPDIRGTMGTFSYYATDLSRYEEGNTEMGGILKRLVFEGDRATNELEGPPNPIVRQQIEAIRHRGPALSETDRATLAELQAAQDVLMPFTIQWNRSAKSATISVDGQTVALEQGKWTPWIDLTFKINFIVRVHGMVQMLLMNAGSELQLYVSPVNFKPDEPPVPMSAPSSFSGDLYKAVGNYRTLGWAEATWALNEGRIDEKTFMDDLMVAFDDRAKVILHRIDAGDWDLLVGVIESTDRVQHMMWRLIDPKHPLYDASLAAQYGDSIERVYRRADQFVGEVVKRVGPGVPVMIVSDHGFHSWRKAVNLDTWLVQNGYMTLKGIQTGDKKLADLFGGGTFWENVDWSHTRVRDGHRPDLFQPSWTRVARDREPRRGSGRARGRTVEEAPDDDGSRGRHADHSQRLQARRDLFGSVPGERRGAAGRHERRLPRLVADDARRLAAGDRLQQRSQVERRSRRLRLPDHVGHPRSAAGRSSQRTPDHRSCADRAEVSSGCRFHPTSMASRCFRRRPEGLRYVLLLFFVAQAFRPASAQGPSEATRQAQALSQRAPRIG